MNKTTDIQKRKWMGLVLPGVAVLSVASSTMAIPTLRLTDGVTTRTITDGEAGDAYGLPGVPDGVVTFIGTLGNFTLNVTTGVEIGHYNGGNPAAPFIELNSISGSTGTGGTLSIQLSEIGYGPSTGTFGTAVGGTLAPGASVVYNAYLGLGNTLFQHSALVATSGIFTTPAFDGEATGSIALIPNPYSLTLETILKHPASPFRIVNGRTIFTTLSSSFDSTVEGYEAVADSGSTLILLGSAFAIFGFVPRLRRSRSPG